MIDKIKGKLKPTRYVTNAAEEMTVLEGICDIGNTLNETVDVVNDMDWRIRGKVSHQEMKEVYRHEGSDFVGSWHGIEKPQFSEPGIAAVVDKNTEEILWLREQKVILEHEIRENDKDIEVNKQEIESVKELVKNRQEVYTSCKTLGFVAGGVDNVAIVNGLKPETNIFFSDGFWHMSKLFTNKCFGSGVIVYGDEHIYLSNVLETIDTEVKDGLRLQNVRIGNSAGSKMSKDARANVAIGYDSQKNNNGGDRNTAVGNGTLFKGKELYSITAVGTDAGRCSDFGDRNTVIGSNAGKWNGSSDVKGDLHDFYLNEVDPFGLKAANPELEKKIGTIDKPLINAVSMDDNVNNTLVGRNAGLHTVISTDCTAVGYNALTHGMKVDKATAIGRGALQSNVLGNNNVSVGALSSVSCQEGYDNTVVGTFAMNVSVKPEKNTVMGYGAMRYNEQPRFNTAVGWAALNEGKTGISNTAVGNMSGMKTGGNGNIAIGSQTYSTASTGNYNTVIGFAAGNEKQDGTSMDGVSGCIILGSNAKVTGASQCQLGQAGTTTFAYGSVQDRSDERDKKDIRETVLGLDFVRQLVPVDYKWNYRGSDIDFKRYHHGFIAQDVQEVIKNTGVDFGGFQNHNMSEGGSDVLSLGYAEFIAPMVKAIQELDKKVRDLEKKLSEKDV